MAQRHLILIHGFLENHVMWSEMLQLISKKNFVIHTPHLPGHHRDVPLRGTSEMKSYCDAIQAQCKIAEEDEVFVIGHSMGGYIASHLVFNLPGKIKGLCLFHSKCSADDAEKIEQRKRAIDAAHKDLSLYVHTMISNQFAPPLRDSLSQKIASQIAFAQSLSSSVIEECQRVMIERPDGLDAMRHRSFPLYYFLGEHDPSIPLITALEEAKALPGALVHIEDRIGHMGHWESTRAAAGFINRILFAAFDEQDV
ncbi:MAG: hypothetical protein RLZZ262_1490 [Bacteroidota bacterium]|jgi:pimeloyl-ACP methyl ester carboxylesterase